MAGVKAVYLVTDLEGPAGVDNWDARHAEYAAEAKGVYERSEQQRLLTGEVNAAAEGLQAAGVEEILINDGHGAGRTILPEALISGVKIVRGTNRPRGLLGCSTRFDAMVQVGMHAMANTPNACLAHTMSWGLVYRVNGREVGEMEIVAYLTGQLEIRWIFTSGDLHACREAEGFVPGIVTAPVKEGLSDLCAIHLAPVDAKNLIRERIQEAVAKADAIEPLTVDGPIVLEVERDEPWPAKLRKGAERVDPFTIRFTGDDFWQTYHLYGRGEANVPLPD